MTHRVGFIMVPTLAIAERDVAEIRRAWNPRELARAAAKEPNAEQLVELGSRVAAASLVAAGEPLESARLAQRDIAAAAHAELAQMQAGKDAKRH